MGIQTTAGNHIVRNAMMYTAKRIGPLSPGKPRNNRIPLNFGSRPKRMGLSTEFHLVPCAGVKVSYSRTKHVSEERTQILVDLPMVIPELQNGQMLSEFGFSLGPRLIAERLPDHWHAPRPVRS